MTRVSNNWYEDKAAWTNYSLARTQPANRVGAADGSELNLVENFVNLLVPLESRHEETNQDGLKEW